MNDPPSENPFRRPGGVRARLRALVSGGGEARALWALGAFGGSVAGLVEGAGLAWSECFGGGPSGALAGILLFPFVLAGYTLLGLLLGGLIGAAASVAPAYALAYLGRRAERSTRLTLRWGWGALVAVPAFLFVVSPETLEPLLVSSGLIHAGRHR
jgi:hypothetical protein